MCSIEQFKEERQDHECKVDLFQVANDDAWVDSAGVLFDRSSKDGTVV